MSILCVTTSFHARFSPATQGIEVVNVLAVCDKWVTHIAITPWETTEQGQCQSFFSYIEVNVDNHIQGESFLTYGTADGSIGAVKLRQQLSMPTSSSKLFEFPQYAIGLITERASSWVYEPDYSGITALQWVNGSDHRVWFSVSILAVLIGPRTVYFGPLYPRINTLALFD